MNPARSRQFTGCLPTLRHTRTAVAVTSGAVAMVSTTSTSFITGAGLKKCRPTTSAGRLVAAAHSITGSEEVVVASTAPGRATSSSAANTARLTARSSATASTNRSQSRNAVNSTAVLVRSSAAARSAALSRPRATARSSERRIRPSAASARSRVRARNTTGCPALAKTSAIPVAMVPVPTTPTARTARAGPSGAVVVAVRVSATTSGESGPA